MWSHLWDGYVRHIQEPGKQPLFLVLVGFIASFLFIRCSVRMIRHGVRWWPGNVTPGGLHIHHVVFGLFFLLVGGVGAFATAGGHPWFDGFGLAFGIGCGLVLDEFALLLHLEDVYWSEQGRKSVDAVIVGILFTGLLLVGYLPLGVTPGSNVRWGLIGIICANALFTVVTLLKGKFWSGMLGIMLPGVSWVGAVLLARPNSPWARWRYAGRPRTYARARRREERWHRRGDVARRWLFDLIAGKPTPPGARPTRAHLLAERVTERMAERMAERTAERLARRLAARPERFGYLSPDDQRVRRLARLNRLAGRRTPVGAVTGTDRRPFGTPLTASLRTPPGRSAGRLPAQPQSPQSAPGVRAQESQPVRGPQPRQSPPSPQPEPQSEPQPRPVESRARRDEARARRRTVVAGRRRPLVRRPRPPRR